ncbi:MAG: PhzF family phenazine biosynthesis protein [Acidobacteriota bacterium]|nr:PhzF family phenazine biosynthesis protein [Acidobacteriota bacterium]
MEIPLLHIDAFTSEAFRGNPAAVCLLEAPKPTGWMQKVAAEMNLPITAFVVQRSNANEADLRWFTPTVEMPLCGHATLASAHALWETGRLTETQEARFHIASGTLVCHRAGKQIEMNFPALPIQEADLPSAIAEAFGVRPRKVFRQRHNDGSSGHFMLELDSEESVRNLNPNFELLRKAAKAGIIVTARSNTSIFDFVSRYFAGYVGIDEDSVTGSAHCMLTPYWAGVLGKAEMTAYQASARGGVIGVRLVKNDEGDRVFLSGEAITVLRGSLLC